MNDIDPVDRQPTNQEILDAIRELRQERRSKKILTLREVAEELESSLSYVQHLTVEGGPLKKERAGRVARIELDRYLAEMATQSHPEAGQKKRKSNRNV